MNNIPKYFFIDKSKTFLYNDIFLPGNHYTRYYYIVLRGPTIDSMFIQLKYVQIDLI